MIEKLRELGLEPRYLGAFKMKGHPYFVSPYKFSDSPNIVATLKGSGDGKSMILNGHIDVVPKDVISGNIILIVVRE